MVYGSFHKSLKNLFDWPETLTLFANYSNSVVIGYPGLQTTAETTDNRYTGKPRAGNNFSSLTGHVSFQIFISVGHLINLISYQFILRN